MRISSRCSFWVMLFFAAYSLQAQSDFYRFRSDFSIKEKETGKDQGRLITGTIFFDKNRHKTVYDIRFPEPEQWFVRDTFMYRIKSDTLLSQQMVPPVGEFSIFNLILSQQLNDFGLAKVGYTPGDIQQGGGQVISRWLPPEKLNPYLGPVDLALENKRLTAAAFYDKDQKLISKFYFQDYTVHNSLPVPGKIYQIFYREAGEFVRIMTLNNVIINQVDEDSTYDFELPPGG
jgi:hypothetical protein